jgi:leader peptidase (prepilin peptidase)/N-methyltransferase
MDSLTVAGAFALGAILGSFLNVCASRLPKGKSLLRPGSSCPACGNPIRWYDNVPLLSFVLLRGRCRACREPISWRYPSVELATALLFGASLLRFGWRWELALALFFVSALVVITVIDLEHHLIPDRITLPAILVGLGGSLAGWRVSWLESLVGLLAGAGIIYTIIVLSRLWLGQDGMGGGDITLSAMLGAFLGWKLLLLALFLAVVLGGAVAVTLLAAGRKGGKDPIPFGPFLAAGGVISLFRGEEILRWYLSGFAA